MKKEQKKSTFVPPELGGNTKRSSRRTITRTTTSTKKTKLDDGCTGDFAFDHLKQQENLSKNTLAELEEKEAKLQKEFDEISRQQPILKRERADIERVVTVELNKRDQITADYQKMLRAFQEEEKRQQLERERKELAARQ
jgi:hypothetical protein